MTTITGHDSTTDGPLDTNNGKGAASGCCQEECCAEEMTSPAEQCAEESDCCQEACCAEDKASTARQGLRENESCQDRCCAEDSSSSATQSPREGVSCQDTCCDNTRSTKGGDTHDAHADSPGKALEYPPCCAGKPSPCCDKSCLERLAARECEQSTNCSG